MARRGPSRGRLTLVPLLAVIVTTTASVALLTGKSHGIINGSPTTGEAYPWVALIHGGGTAHPDRGYVLHRFTCTGSLVAPRTILTAAHCTYGLPRDKYRPLEPMDFTVWLGKTLRDDRQGQRLGVEQVLRQDRFKPRRFHFYDVALLVLDKSPNAVPIGIAGSADRARWSSGRRVTAVGWGRTQEKPKAKSPDQLVGRIKSISLQIALVSRHDGVFAPHTPLKRQAPSCRGA
jgi:secreted trypsin-like serine protease